MINRNIKLLITFLQSKGLDKKVIAAAAANADLESGGGRFLYENLNYSAAALMSTFPSIYKNKPDDAEHDARHPVLIANRVYSQKMGNGDYFSGDGWKYRGRGLIQITGRFLYLQYFKWCGNPSLDPDLLSSDVTHAVNSAYWFLFIYNEDRFKNAALALDLKKCRGIVNPALLNYDVFKTKFDFYHDQL